MVTCDYGEVIINRWCLIYTLSYLVFGTFRFRILTDQPSSSASPVALRISCAVYPDAAQILLCLGTGPYIRVGAFAAPLPLLTLLRLLVCGCPSLRNGLDGEEFLRTFSFIRLIHSYRYASVVDRPTYFASLPNILNSGERRRLRACEKIPPRLRAPLNVSGGVAGPPISGHVELATLPAIGTPAPCQTRPEAPSLRAGICSQALSCFNLRRIISVRFFLEQFISKTSDLKLIIRFIF